MAAVASSPLRFALAAAVASSVASLSGGVSAASERTARERLIPFVERMYGPQYQASRVHHAIGEALERVERGELKRVVIQVPPRHGKSVIASEHFPAWYLGRNPDKRIIACSYAAHLAYRFSRRARAMLAAPQWPWPAVGVSADEASVAAWGIAGGRGGYVAAGVGGSVTGLGADVLLIDDPVKNQQEADSATYRDRVWDWYQSTALTRVEPGGAVVIIMTRWHEDDLVGRVLADDPDGWEVIDLPAICERDGDPLGRSVGDALWPERWPVAALEARREAVGSRVWSALYQQHPAPAEGSILKREWWLDDPEFDPEYDWIVQAWDTAFKTGRENDWSACVTVGLAGSRFRVIDVWRDRVEFPQLARAVRSQQARWRPDEILVEDAGSGQSLIQMLASGDEPGAVPLPVVPIRPDRDKTARVHAVSPFFEARRVAVPAGARWRDDLVEECAAFPTAAHDDQVDALVMAVTRLAERAAVLRPVGTEVAEAFMGLPG